MAYVPPAARGLVQGWPQGIRFIKRRAGQNQQTEIQDHLDAGVPIMFDEGIIRAEKIDIPPEGARIYGSGRGRTLLQKIGTNTASFIASADRLVGSHGVRLAHLTVDGNRTAFEASIAGDGDSQGIRCDMWRTFDLYDLAVINAGTDGIHLGMSANDVAHYCADGWISHVDVSGSRRNEMSVISAKDLWVQYSKFRGANGIAPKAGLDLEPDSPFCHLENINLHALDLSENDAYGLLLILQLLTAGRGVSIFGSGLRMNRNGVNGLRVGWIPDTIGRGIIQLQGSAVGNVAQGYYLDEISALGPLIDLDIALGENANGVIPTPDPTAAQGAIYSFGAGSGLTATPGNIRIRHRRAWHSLDRLLFYVSGNAKVRRVETTFEGYDAAAGAQLYGWGDFGDVLVSDTHGSRRELARVVNTAIDAGWHETRITNAGAAGLVTINLPAAPDPAVQVLRYHFEVKAAQVLQVAPQAGERIGSAAAGVAVASDVPGTRLVLRNSVAGRWVADKNGGFA